MIVLLLMLHDALEVKASQLKRFAVQNIYLTRMSVYLYKKLRKSYICRLYSKGKSINIIPRQSTNEQSKSGKCVFVAWLKHF